ncbi:MAG TPA: hypothetical protein VLJ83_06265 [Gemmatimonadaceae bacterium]|nr:hypothetical protein [Gemmatimonadaceae bacterium]
MLRASTPHRRRNRSRWVVVVAALLAVEIGCASVDTPVVAANPGVAFALPVGKTATVNGNSARITFNRVTDDSRCPVDVVCIWAGDAKVELAITRNGSPADTQVISITSPNNEVVSGDLRIRLVGLAPAPRQSEPSARRAYVAQLVVTPG